MKTDNILFIGAITMMMLIGVLLMINHQDDPKSITDCYDGNSNVILGAECEENSFLYDLGIVVVFLAVMFLLVFIMLSSMRLR